MAEPEPKSGNTRSVPEGSLIDLDEKHGLDSSGPTVPSSASASQLVHDQPPVASASRPSPERSSSTPDEVPFDFQTFLDQMKSKSAEPVAKYLRSFLTNFSRKPFSANDQVKLIRDFLDFIFTRMVECDIWKNLSPPEFENATEAMEKLVMNRLYDYTFTPQIQASGRSVTTDDLEKDQVLEQRIGLFRWIREEHLDITTGEGSQGFTSFAQSELLKINHFKAPRDKLICVLNCCKVIFGLLRHQQGEESADAFIPVLIFVVLKANPEHLLSNVEYINRFRNPAKLQSEAGYYLSSLMAAVSFIETMDHSSLSNITKEGFEANVEEAIRTLPPPIPTNRPTSNTSRPPTSLSTSTSTYTGDESARPLRFSFGGSLPSAGVDTSTFAEDARRFFQRTGETISKPVNAIGKILSEALDGLDLEESERQGGASGSGQQQNDGTLQQPTPTPYKARIRPSLSNPTNRMSTPDALASSRGQTPTPDPRTGAVAVQSPPMDFTAMQLEIDHAHELASRAARETLRRIFPNVDDEVADMVLEANHGNVGLAIDQLLEISS